MRNPDFLLFFTLFYKPVSYIHHVDSGSKHLSPPPAPYQPNYAFNMCRIGYGLPSPSVASRPTIENPCLR